MSDDRLIVALDAPNIIAGMDIVNKLGATVSFYKIGLGMLTGGGLALADELKQEHNKRIFLDLKLPIIGISWFGFSNFTLSTSTKLTCWANINLTENKNIKKCVKKYFISINLY